MESNKKYYTIGSITKVCNLLNVLAERKEWELAELCRTLDMPKTTVHRMLLTLEDEGFVLQESRGGKYSLSYKLFQLGRKIVDFSNIVDISRRTASRLHEEIDETVNICVRSDIDMIILDKKASSHALRTDNLVGTSFPVFYSASGKVCLAFTDPDHFTPLLQKIRQETIPIVTDKTFRVFLQEVEEARTTGFAYDYEEVFPGVRCIAVPLLDFTNTSAGALSVSVPTVRLYKKAQEHIEQALFRAGRDISLKMGTTHPLYAGNDDA